MMPTFELMLDHVDTIPGCGSSKHMHAAYQTNQHLVTNIMHHDGITVVCRLL